MVRKKSSNEISLSERLSHIEGWRQSDLTRPDYCRQHSIKLNQLTFWQQQHRKSGNNQKRNTSAPFARVAISKKSPTTPLLGAARLIVAGGITIELESGSDPAWVAQLVLAIGGHR